MAQMLVEAPGTLSWCSLRIIAWMSSFTACQGPVGFRKLK